MKIYIIAGVPLGLLILYFLYRFILGVTTTSYMKKFAHAYDEAIAQSQSSKESFIRAVEEFKKSYPFRKLSNSEWDSIINTFTALDNPRDSFLHVVSFSSNKKVLECFKNPDFLKELKLTKE